MKLKKLFKKGYISIEYVIIAALIVMITAAGAPRIYQKATDMTMKKADSVNSYIYTIETSTENITATGGKHHTNTVAPPDVPIDPGDGTVQPNPGDGLTHPTHVSLWVDAQTTGGPIAETTDPINISLYPGEQIRVKGRVLPIDSNNLAIRWVNYNADIATANQNGLITAITPGDALIRVEAIDNGASNEINVHVRHVVATDFDIIPDKLTMTVDDVEEVFVKFYPENTTLRQCTFTSNNTALVQVEQNTTTSAIFSAINAEKNNNKTTVTVVCQSQNAAEEPVEIEKNIEIEVLGKMVNTESITLVDEEIVLEVGDTYQINATVHPSDASVKELEYESLNDAVANVNVSGLVSAVAVGETYIYVRNYGGDYYGKEIFTAMKVTVNPKTIPVTAIDIEYAHNELPAGQTMSPIVTYTPGTTTQRDIIWTSSNPDVLKVGANGQVQGVTEGTATITAVSASNSSVKDTFKITVTGRIDKVTGVNIHAETTTVVVDETIFISAEIEPETAYNKNVSWTSSNPSVCVVNNGMVTGIIAGECTVTVRTEDGGFTDSINITVTEIAVTDITIAPTEAKIGIGDVVQFEATITPSNATRNEITWSYYELSTGLPQENIIILDNGIVTGVGYGTIMVRATASNGDFAEAMVTVAEVFPNKIEMPEKITLNKGASYPISAKVLPENSVSKALTWTSANQSLVAVDQSGIVTASSVFYGTTTITATWTNGEHTVTGQTIVEVLPTMPDLIVFNPESYTLKVDETINGTLTVRPVNTDFHEVTYTVSDPAIFSVEDKGLSADGITCEFSITGLSIGEAELIATTTEGNVVGRATVTVTTNEIFANMIYSDNSIVEIKIGETFKPIVKFSPENTTNKELKWESEDSLIASVNSDGVITGVSIGTTFVNVQSQSNGSWYKFTVIVSGLEPHALSVTPATMELYKLTETQEYEITILPADSVDTGYYYEVYDKDGVKIENTAKYLHILMTGKNTGTINGRKVGDYTVRFVVTGYPEIYDEIDVSVVSSPWDGNVFIDTDMTIENNTCYPEDGWQLAWIAYQANLGTLVDYCKIVSQQADIDLNNHPWTPMAINEPFQATYFGNGHSVKNMYVNGDDIFSILKDGQEDVVYDYGLFGNVRNQVTNLNIHNATIDYTGKNLPNDFGGNVFIGVAAGRALLLSGIDVVGSDIVINTNTNEHIYTGSIAGLIGDNVIKVPNEQDGSQILFNQAYSGYNTNYELGFIGEMSLVFREDGSVEQYVNDVLVQTLPYTYTDGVVNVPGYGQGYALEEGQKLYLQDMDVTLIAGDAAIIEEGALYMYVPDSQIWNVTYGENVSVINLKSSINGNKIVRFNEALEFNGTNAVDKVFPNVVAIYIPADIDISAPAFQNCVPNLGYIYYGGTKAQWDETYTHVPDGITIVYNADGLPSEFTYEAYYESVNGEYLNSDFLTGNFGETVTVIPPTITGYKTPSTKTVKLGTPKTEIIKFQYEPEDTWVLKTGKYATASTSPSGNQQGTTITASASYSDIIPTKITYSLILKNGSNNDKRYLDVNLACTGGGSESYAITVPAERDVNYSYGSTWSLSTESTSGTISVSLVLGTYEQVYDVQLSAYISEWYEKEPSSY